MTCRLPMQIPALAKIGGVDHLLYGSESSITPEPVIERQIRSITGSGVMEDSLP